MMMFCWLLSEMFLLAAVHQKAEEIILNALRQAVPVRVNQWERKRQAKYSTGTDRYSPPPCKAPHPLFASHR